MGNTEEGFDIQQLDIPEQPSFEGCPLRTLQHRDDLFQIKQPPRPRQP